MSARRLCAAGLLALACAPAAAAQEPVACAPFMTVGECLSRLLGELSGDLPAQEAQATAREVTRATTGAQTNFDLPVTVRDFLPQVAAALITPGLSTEREALALRVNHALSLGTLQVAVELPEPEPFGPLLEAVAEDRRDALRERLEGALEDADDVTGTLALNFEGRTWGRRFRPHAADITTALQDVFRAPAADEEQARDALVAVTRLVARERAAGRVTGGECGPGLRVDDLPLRCLESGAAEEAEALLATAAAQVQLRRARRAATLERMRFSVLPMLLNNQRQLNLAVSYRYRDDLVGPDEITGSLRYEHGSTSLNSLRRHCGGQVRGDCLTSYLTDSGTTAALARGRRFTAQVDLAWREAYDAVVPGEAPQVVVAEARTFGLKGSLAYGQYFGRLVDGTRRPRIDLQLDVEHQLEGVLRNDRVVGRAAYTHPMSDQLAGVFGVVWANKPEYLGDVDRRVTARLGLTYKLVQPE